MNSRGPGHRLTSKNTGLADISTSMPLAASDGKSVSIGKRRYLNEQLHVQPHENWPVAVPLPVMCAAHCVGDLMQQAP